MFLILLANLGYVAKDEVRKKINRYKYDKETEDIGNKTDMTKFEKEAWEMIEKSDMPAGKKKYVKSVFNKIRGKELTAKNKGSIVRDMTHYLNKNLKDK